MSKDNPTPTVPMTEEQFKAALPVQVKKLVTQELMDQINQTLSRP